MAPRREAPERYVPAAGRVALTGIYDVTLTLTMRERRWRPELVRRVAAATPDGGRIVDVGAGTGTVAIALAAARPDADVLAIDGDPKVLELARRKPGSERVQWQEGLAGRLELEDASADAAVMSLLLHHLTPAAKEVALRDVRRVLRKGGRLFVADWGRPRDPLMRAAFRLLQLIDGSEGTRDHAEGRLPEIIAGAGFDKPRLHRRVRTGWGSLELLEAAA